MVYPFLMRCPFCYRHCDVTSSFHGFCGGRTAKDGKLEDLYYGRLASVALDPVEKKPLYHFLPGTKTLSLCMEGCDFDCDFCQNWEIARRRSRGLPYVAPEEIVEYALSLSCPSISYTYTEPLVWQDYMLAVQAAASGTGLKGIMVSNGSFSEEAMDAVIPCLDAFNIDLKGDEEYYRRICHGSIKPVLDGIERIVQEGKHLEVTTMVIEGIHDLGMIEKLGALLYQRGVKVWHISRFFPMRRMADRQPTSERFLSEALKKARDSKIPHIYAGNSRIKTPVTCPECGRETDGGLCNHCRVSIYGVWTTTG